MKSTKKILLICFGLLTTFIFSCKKEAGDGGKASLHGLVIGERIITTPYVAPFLPIGTRQEYPAAYENVYIIYGNDISYGDKTETNGEGKFEFKYLREGSYKIYVYSKDSTGDASKPKFAVIKDVKVKSKKETVDAGFIKIFTYQ